MEARLFKQGTIPEWTTPEWYANRETAPHLEQAGHRERLHEAARLVKVALHDGAKSVVDLGAGDGGLLTLVNPQQGKWGYDLQQSNVFVAGTKRNVLVHHIDVVNNPGMVNFADVAVATEMLEHLIDPHKFVRWIFESKTKWLVASSPYTETVHNHYEFHTWAWDTPGYAKMIKDAGWTVKQHTTITMAQVILAAKE